MKNFLFTGELSNNSNDIIKVRLDIYIFKDNDVFITYCPALDLSGCGNTESEAKKSFEISLEMFIEYGINKRTLIKDLEKHGWNIKKGKQQKFKAPGFLHLYQNNEELRDILENKEYTKYGKSVGMPVIA